jgi:hypothetical protein
MEGYHNSRRGFDDFCCVGLGHVVRMDFVRLRWLRFGGLIMLRDVGFLFMNICHSLHMF